MSRRRKRRRPFLLMDKQVLKSPEWKKLSLSEKLLYLYVKTGYNGSNNGDIPFNKSEYVRSKENPTGEFSDATLSKVLGGVKEKGSLVVKGWIERKTIGGRHRYKNFFRLTGKFDILE